MGREDNEPDDRPPQHSKTRGCASLADSVEGVPQKRSPPERFCMEIAKEEVAVPIPTMTSGDASDHLVATFEMDLEPIPQSAASRTSTSRPGAFHQGGMGFPRRNRLEAQAAYQDAILNNLDYPISFIAHLHTEDADTVNAICSSHAEGGQVYEGKLVRATTQQKKNMGWFVIATIAIVGAVVLLLLVFFLRDAPEEEETKRVEETMEGSTKVLQVPFSNDLPDTIVYSIRNDEDSPFSQANLWLLRDPSYSSYSLPRKKQRFYLAMLYYATYGEAWIHSDHWLSYNVSECQWFSHSSYALDSPYHQPLICDGNGTFINLSLADNNLTGHLPIWYTSFLPYLKVLDLSNNKIGGQIPPVTTSDYLEVWMLSNTDFEGRAIVNAGTFGNLKVFEFENGKVWSKNQGALNYIISTAEYMNIQGMKSGGPMHSTIGLLTNLQVLIRGHTEGVGTIPTEIGLLADLRYLDLSSLPNFYGTLPSELGLLTQLAWLDFSGTPITGSVPSSLCQRVESGLLDLVAECDYLECCK